MGKWKVGPVGCPGIIIRLTRLAAVPYNRKRPMSIHVATGNASNTSRTAHGQEPLRETSGLDNGSGVRRSSLGGVEMKTILKVGYAGLDRGQLLARAFELGFAFEKHSHSCSQSTVAAMHEMLEIDDVVVRVATSSAGGQAARVTGTCGALIGGTIVLDYFFGRPVADLSHTDQVQANLAPLHGAVEVAGSLFDRFVAEHGTVICPHLQTRLYGRPYFISDEQEMAKFEQIGGHADPEKSCCRIVGNTSRWVLELLIDKNLISV